MSRKRRRIRPRRIALAYQLGAPYQERITHGVLRYAQENGPIEVVSSPEGGALPLSSLSSWKGDGVIAMLETSEQVAIARVLPFPVINIANSLQATGIPAVAGDQRAMGRLAAEHLLERNFRRFGFYGLKGVWYSGERFAGFRDRLSEEGFPCRLYETESSLLSSEPWRLDQQDLAEWVGEFQFPAGIFAAHDYRARMVLERCVELGIAVPEELGVVGVDDDPVVCEFSTPTLTSIRQNGQEAGFRAALLLNQLMEGESKPARTQLIAPEGLMARDSTKVTAVDDPALRDALQLIERHSRELIDVAWLVSRVGVSRRKLETLFQNELAKTPHECLSEARVRRAEAIWRKDRELPIREVAKLSGFSEARRLSLVFKRVTGKTPKAFRDALK